MTQMLSGGGWVKDFDFDFDFDFDAAMFGIGID